MIINISWLILTKSKDIYTNKQKNHNALIQSLQSMFWFGKKRGTWLLRDSAFKVLIVWNL